MIALLLALLSTIMLPLTKLEWQSIPFIALTAVTLAFAAGSTIRQTRYKPALFITGFWVVCLAHVMFILSEDVTVGEYLRGLVPFIFLGYFFFVVRLVSLQNFNTLYYGIICVSLCYAAQNLILLPKFLSGEVWRTTFENVNHAVPFPVVGFPCCVALILGRNTPPHHKLPLTIAAIALLTSSFLTGTRSLILATLVPLLWMPFAKGKFESGRLVRYGIILALLGAALMFIPTDTLLKSARIGYTQSGSIDTRLQEHEVVLGYISRSPIIGNGLGFRFDTNGLYYAATRVGYVHNSYLYLLMDFGIFAFLYVAAPIFALRSLKLVRSGPHGDHAIGLSMGLIGMLIFCLGFAEVRLMHFNILLGVVMAMLEVLKRDYVFGWRIWKQQMDAYSHWLRAVTRAKELAFPF